jgi:hypothetical protein
MRRRSRLATRRSSAAPPALALLVALGAAAAAAEPKETVPCEQVASIGVATMTDDGVLTLRLRSLPPGPIGEGTMRYKPGDREYEDIKKHIGGIKPGETKPVRPWC